MIAMPRSPSSSGTRTCVARDFPGMKRIISLPSGPTPQRFVEMERHRSSKAPAVGRHAGRPDAVLAPQRRRDQLGALHARPRSLGGEKARGVSENLRRVMGPRVLRPSAEEDGCAWRNDLGAKSVAAKGTACCSPFDYPLSPQPFLCPTPGDFGKLAHRKWLRARIPGKVQFFEELKSQVHENAGLAVRRALRRRKTAPGRAGLQ